MTHNFLMGLPANTQCARVSAIGGYDGTIENYQLISGAVPNITLYGNISSMFT